MKKSPYDPKKYSERVKKLHLDYIETIEKIDVERLFFIDETGANLNCAPLYGRASRNERVYDEQPVARGQRISMVGALTTSGIKTALNFSGTMTGFVFLYFLENFLCPLLSEGDCVVMDNASVHKVDEVKQLIEKAGASVVFLPPYSPDLNPIELAWNKIKTYLRKKRARTTDELYKAYAEALKLVTVEDSKRFITHSMKFLK